MRKNKRLLTYQERSDRNLMWFTAAVAFVVCIVIYVLPSGLEEWNGDPSGQHSQSLLQQMASYF